jgi:hypothetical protein
MQKELFSRIIHTGANVDEFFHHFWQSMDSARHYARPAISAQLVAVFNAVVHAALLFRTVCRGF